MALRRVTIAFGLLTVALLTGRFILLGADVPQWFAPTDLGLHLDDGYKTLSARNYVDFGQTHWNPEDGYPGWARTSPLTHWLYTVAYTIGGVQVTSVRLVGVLFFLALVGTFVFTFRRDYPPWAIAGGAAVLSLEPMLYQFSRTALFEVPLSFLIAVGAFAVFRVRDRGMLVQMFLLAIAAFAASRLVKPSVFLYMAPAFAALLVRALIKQQLSRRVWLGVAIGSGLILMAAVYETRGMWITRTHLEHPAHWIPRRLLFSGLQDLTPFYVGAALLCMVHGLATRAKDYLDDSYRVVLISIFLSVPLMLTILWDPPPRYYVAVVASATLLVIDHFGRGLHTWSNTHSVPKWARLSVGVLAVLLVWYLLRGIDYAVLRPLDNRGEYDGILPETMYGLFAPVAAAAFLSGIVFTGLLARPRLFRTLIIGLLVAALGMGLAEQSRTLLFPTFNAQRIRGDLVALVGDDESVAGDWAPILTIGTGLRSLYVNEWYNRPEEFLVLRPDYFLDAQSWHDERNIARIESDSLISLGEMVPLGKMFGNELRLYPLHYPENSGGEER
jgi:4-amino-4-deoxy-L-arabinose transferase-like glycosyltransferase